MKKLWKCEQTVVFQSLLLLSLLIMGAISSSSYEECVSNLLCAEDASNVVGISSDDENENENNNNNNENGDEEISEQKCFFPYSSSSSYCFPAADEEEISGMVERESDFMPLQSYRDRRMDFAAARESAVGWILKVHAFYSFGPLTAYLSISYLDRFLSRYQLPEGKAWMLQLLSVACLSLAAKVEETDVPLLLDLQTEAPKFIFEAGTVKRMELLVLSTLQWRMLSVTPFSFLDYFFSKGGGNNSGKPPPRAMAARAADLLLSTIEGIHFLEHRPSAMAGAVVIIAAEEFLRPEIAAQYRNGVLSCSIINKDSIFKCYNSIQQLLLQRFPAALKSKRMLSVSSSPSIPRSPVGVLDALNTITNSTTSSFEQSLKSVNLYASVAAKRRKLDVYCNPC